MTVTWWTVHRPPRLRFSAMRPNGGFPCASLLGIVVMGGDATDGGAGDRVPFTDEMPTDPVGGRAPDATLGQYGRRRHRE
jgi:hypothetical protein